MAQLDGLILEQRKTVKYRVARRYTKAPAKHFSFKFTKITPIFTFPFQNVLFVCQSPLSSAAINPVLPHEFVIGTADSHVYVMDRRKLSAGCLFSPIQSIVASMKVPSLTNNSCRTTSVQFSPEGDQVLASFSGEGVYLFDVKVSCI